MVKDSLPTDGSESSLWAHADRGQRRHQARTVGTAGHVDVLVAERTGAIGDTRTDHDQRTRAEPDQAGDRQFLVQPLEQRATGCGEDHLVARCRQPRQRLRARMQAHPSVHRHRPGLGTAPGQFLGEVATPARCEPEGNALAGRCRQRREGEHALAVLRTACDVGRQAGGGQRSGGAPADRDERRAGRPEPGPMVQRRPHRRPADQHVHGRRVCPCQARSQSLRGRCDAGVLQRHRQHVAAGGFEHTGAGRGLGGRAGQQDQRRLIGRGGFHAA